MFRNNSTIAQRKSFLSDKKSGIISIVEKLTMGILLCALLLGVHYSYKTIQNRYLLVKSKLDSGKSAISQLAGIYGTAAPQIHEGEMEAGFAMPADETPLPAAEVNAAEMVIVVPEIERSTSEKKVTTKPIDKTKCTAIGHREQCDQHKADCCDKKAESSSSLPAVVKENEIKKKKGSTRKSRQISDQKHFGVGLKFTV